MHVKIEPTDGFSVVNHIPGFDGRMPRRHVHLLLERDVKERRCGAHDPLLHFREWQVRTNTL